LRVMMISSYESSHGACVNERAADRAKYTGHDCASLPQTKSF
jgi:hypothetical protein